MDLWPLILFLLLLLPFWLAVVEVRIHTGPEHLRRFGVIVRRPEALQERCQVIGRFMDRDIYASVRFQNRMYIFDRTAPATYKSFLRSGELFLEPGLVYVMDGPDRPISQSAG